MSYFLGINLTTNIGPQLKAWEERYVSQASFKQYQRACAYVMDQTAKDLRDALRDVAGDVLDMPTPWTKMGFQYRRTLDKFRGAEEGVASEFFVMDDQSAVLKYHLGMQENIRVGGDVGLYNGEALLPAWKNLAKLQGIRANKYGYLPGGVMTRFEREANNDRNKRRRDPKSAGFFKQEVTLNRVTGTAYMNRPTRRVTNQQKILHNADSGRFETVKRVVSNDRPRVLMYSIPKATYEPRLQGVWDWAVDEAVKKIPEKMGAELAQHIQHNRMHGR